MPHTQLRAMGGAVAALALGACLVIAPAPAQAALPSKHTVYKGDGSQAGVDTTVTFTLKVGDNSSRFKKATVKVHCPTDSNKVVFKNVKIDSGGNFEKYIVFPGGSLPRFLLSGKVRTKHKIDVTFYTEDSGEPCGNYVMEGVAKD